MFQVLFGFQICLYLVNFRFFTTNSFVNIFGISRNVIIKLSESLQLSDLYRIVRICNFGGIEFIVNFNRWIMYSTFES